MTERTYLEFFAGGGIALMNGKAPKPPTGQGRRSHRKKFR